MSPLVKRCFDRISATENGLTAPELAKIEHIPDKEATWVIGRLLNVFNVVSVDDDGRCKKK
jgi:hypothetical protein